MGLARGHFPQSAPMTRDLAIVRPGGSVERDAEVSARPSTQIEAVDDRRWLCLEPFTSPWKKLT
jgi:hypothetical protein